MWGTLTIAAALAAAMSIRACIATAGVVIGDSRLRLLLPAPHRRHYWRHAGRKPATLRMRGAALIYMGVTRVWLIRHGQPDEEARQRCYGSLDVGLSDIGRCANGEVSPNTSRRSRSPLSTAARVRGPWRVHASSLRRRTAQLRLPRIFVRSTSETSRDLLTTKLPREFPGPISAMDGDAHGSSISQRRMLLTDAFAGSKIVPRDPESVGRKRLSPSSATAA